MPSESVRRRKLAQGDHVRNDKIPRRKSAQQQAKIQQNNLIFSFLCLLACVVLFIVFFGFYIDVHPFVDKIATKLGYEGRQYAVIIDAGSTGSRVLAYTFHTGYSDGRLFLDRELFKETKPGLSSYADNPAEGAKSIDKLLNEAKNVIPSEFWASTPLVLRATAGLRLLDAEKADNLLNTVREMFETSGFNVDMNSVEIMEGIDEGMFSWFTVNFLLSRLRGEKTVAALDLGGGSTQVTFVPTNKDNDIRSLQKHLQTVPIANHDVQVFTHSYLGLGLQAIRHAVFTSGASDEGQEELTSECLNPIIENKQWKYANKVYTIHGKKNSNGKAEVDFEECLKIVRQKTLPLVQPKPISLNEQTMAAFSYYFERAIETGLVDPIEGGEIKVGDYMEKAKEICAIANVDQKFMCVDLVYISVLLQDGYQLKPETKLKLFKKVDGHEISWALGCAYSILTK